ncbi:MAG: hypothetical protein HYV40_03645 [Candidatus Levybacteria bacterium]|nr:hypothetical protein [Candidatus Levybacteria bacterium]
MDPELQDGVYMGAASFLRDHIFPSYQLLPRVTLSNIYNGIVSFLEDSVSGEMPEYCYPKGVPSEGKIILNRADKPGFPSPHETLWIIQRYGIATGKPQSTKEVQRSVGGSINPLRLSRLILEYPGTAELLQKIAGPLPMSAPRY